MVQKERSVAGQELYPPGGDLIFFDRGGDGHCDYVDIVEKCEGSVVYTIEGNSSDACKRQHYKATKSPI